MAITHNAVKSVGEKGFASEWNDDHVIAADTIKDTHIDFGSGAGQVDADDIGDGTTNKMLTTGSQTIAGEKTFSTFPITPTAAPDANYEVANKKYVDDSAGGGDTNKCILRRTSAQSMTKDLMHAIEFTTEDYDGNAMHDPATNPDRITIQSDGIYLINASFEWANGSNFDFDAQITNGASVLKILYFTGVARAATGASISVIANCVATDIIMVQVEQYSGGTINMGYAYCEVAKLV